MSMWERQAGAKTALYEKIVRQSNDPKYKINEEIWVQIGLSNIPSMGRSSQIKYQEL